MADDGIAARKLVGVAGTVRQPRSFERALQERSGAAVSLHRQPRERPAPGGRHFQEVFIRIYRKLRWLREPEAFRAWTYQIASREAFRYLNRERRWSDQIRDEATLTALPANDPEREFSRELIESLPQLVENLSPASRAVVVLFYLHELSLVETAAVLDIPVGTAKSRLAYGLESLRRSFQREEK